LSETDINDESKFVTASGSTIDKARAALVGKAREEAYKWKADVEAGKYPFYDVVDKKQVQ